MVTLSTNELKNGLRVIIDNDPYQIVECDFVKPGKGQAFTRVKMRNLKTGRIVDRTYKSGESLEGADVVDTEMQYLYNDGEFWHFMVPSSFEQYAVAAEVVGDAAKWLKGQETCLVTLWNGNPISVEAPKFVVLQVTDTDPGLRGDTSGGGNKPATLEGGAVVRVPLFIEIGETIKVDTRTGEYVARAKE